jgi:hypothetical protein
MKSELVKPTHLTRKAVVYIRQSTPHQVVSNQESLRLQYALRQRARELGWHEADIDVIDADLGLSGASAAGRSGFKELVALYFADDRRLDKEISHLGCHTAYISPIVRSYRLPTTSVRFNPSTSKTFRLRALSRTERASAYSGERYQALPTSIVGNSIRTRARGLQLPSNLSITPPLARYRPP